MTAAKRSVYVLKNAEPKPRFYVGLTSDIRGRLEDHNAGRCPHAARHRPWQLHVVIVFPDEARAIRFERYLKSGSRREFARRPFEEVTVPDRTRRVARTAMNRSPQEARVAHLPGKKLG